MRIDTEIVIDVVSMVGTRIIFEHRGKPDCGTAQSGNVFEIAGDTLDIASVKVVRSGDAERASRTGRDLARYAVLKPIDQQKIDKLFSPLPINIEICLAGNGN